MKNASTHIRPLASLLLCVYVLSCARVYLPYLNYFVNYDYITVKLCENKNKPEMHCNGKCHLAREIKKVSEEEPTSGKTPVVQKMNVFQELPVQAMQLHQLYQLSGVDNGKSLPINYTSPAREITSPPPKTA